MLSPSWRQVSALLISFSQVKGRRLDTEGGIRTRARARTTAEQWSVVPLRIKLVQLLTDAFIEATTQGEACPAMTAWCGLVSASLFRQLQAFNN